MRKPAASPGSIPPQETLHQDATPSEGRGRWCHRGSLCRHGLGEGAAARPRPTAASVSPEAPAQGGFLLRGTGGSGSGLHQQARNMTQIQEVGRGAPATSTGPVLTLHFRTLALQGHTGSQNICKDSDMAKDREVAVALDFF